eukprot:TsM_000303400 transcript=TsM_000303400 gene=TsM_000303400
MKLPKTGIPPAYKDILARVWAENPNLRPTFGDLNREIQQMTKGKQACKIRNPFNELTRKTNIVENVFKVMEDYSCRLEERVKIRTQELEIEKRKKDLPIQRMLPP